MTVAGETTDGELLGRCRRGDAAAWDALVRRYERLVYSVALRNGLGPEDASDVCQMTFMALLESIDKVRTTDRLASWLMTVARRHAWRCNARLRRERPVAQLPDTEDASAVGWDQIVTLHEALARLETPCRELLTALYFDPVQPSYATLASRFGRAVGGIGPLRGRCLERIRALMDGP